MSGGGWEAAHDHNFYCQYYKSFGEIRMPTEGFVVEVEFHDLKISSSDVSTTQAMHLYNIVFYTSNNMSAVART